MDVYSALEPVFYPSRLLGVSPLEMTGDVGNRKMVRSTGAVIYSCFFLVGCLVAVSQILERFSDVSEYSSMNKIVVLIIYNCDVYLAMFVIFMSAFRANAFCKFMHGLEANDKSMGSIMLVDFYKENKGLRRHAFIRLAATFFLYFLGALLVSYAAYSYVTTHPESHVIFVALYWTLSLSSQIINTLFTINFTHCVYILKEKFGLINKKISDYTEPDIIPTRYFDKQNKIIPVKSVKMDGDVDILRSIQTLHCNLCDLSREINDIFSVQLLLYIATVFVRVTGGLNACFENIRSYFGDGPHDGPSLPRIVFELYIVIIFIVQVTAIALYCAIAITEANNTAVLVHTLMAESKDNAVKDQLELFSLQLLHRKVQFSACGFFPIDATLLYSIVGGVTTYLVILIQFQLSDSSAKSNNSTNSTNITVVANKT